MIQMCRAATGLGAVFNKQDDWLSSKADKFGIDDDNCRALVDFKNLRTIGTTIKKRADALTNLPPGKVDRESGCGSNESNQPGDASALLRHSGGLFLCVNRK